MPKLRMNLAICQALADELELDPNVVFLGEDVAGRGGTFKTSEGLLDRFGSSRVIDTPISEMGFTGAALGAAMRGLRPVVEIMFFEFIGVALDQLSTEAAKMRYLSAGEVTVPLTVRGSTGAGMGFAATHSQTLETLLYATPGLKVAVASGARSGYGLLRSAIRDDNPVVLLEPRNLYATREEFETGEDALIPLGQAATVREGSDVTVVALGQSVAIAQQVVGHADGWSPEIIDLQTLVPWDREAVRRSVAKTGRLVVLEESHYSGGWGTEIVADIAAHCHGELTVPPMRITCPDTPVPFSPELERRFLPQPEDAAIRIGQLLDTGKLPPPWWEESEMVAGSASR